MKSVLLLAIALVGFASVDAVACMSGNCGPRGGFGGGSVTQISVSFSARFQSGGSQGGGCGINPCGPQQIYNPAVNMGQPWFPQQGYNQGMYMGGAHMIGGGYMQGGGFIQGGHRMHGGGHCQKFRRIKRCGHRKMRGRGCGSGRRGGSLSISARGKHGSFKLKARWRG